jgi:hypothetical protein
VSAPSWRATTGGCPYGVTNYKCKTPSPSPAGKWILHFSRKNATGPDKSRVFSSASPESTFHIPKYNAKVDSGFWAQKRHCRPLSSGGLDRRAPARPPSFLRQKSTLPRAKYVEYRGILVAGHAGGWKNGIVEAWGMAFRLPPCAPRVTLLASGTRFAQPRRRLRVGRECSAHRSFCEEGICDNASLPGVVPANRRNLWTPALPIIPGTNRLLIVTESTVRSTSGDPKHEPTYRSRPLNRLFSCLVLYPISFL